MPDLSTANGQTSWSEHRPPRVLSAEAKASQVPAGQRGTCFIIGGVPYGLAKVAQQGQEPFTVLHPPAAYAQLTGAKATAGLNICQAVAATSGQQFGFGYDTTFTIGYLLALPWR